MNRRFGVILALVLSTAFGACASGGGGAPAGAQDAEQEYPEGTEPSDNDYTNAAGLFLAQAVAAEEPAATQLYRQSLEQALLGVEEEPGNPKPYFMAGQSYIGVGDFVAADSMFDRAEEIYPAYEPEIDAEREQGWIKAYNQGVRAIQAQNLEEAKDHFQQADVIFKDRHEAYMNLAWVSQRLGDAETAMEAYRNALDVLRGPKPETLTEEQAASWDEDLEAATLNLAQVLAETGRHAEAAEMLGRHIEENPDDLSALVNQANLLVQAGREDEAQQIYDDLLGRPDLGPNEFFQIGIGFFNAEDYEQAAEAFARAAEMNPHSRDAFYNMVQALYSKVLDAERDSTYSEEQLEELYERVIEGADKVLEFDPANRNILTFQLRSYRGLSDIREGEAGGPFRDAVRATLDRYQSMPFEVTSVGLSIASESQAQISGSVTNLTLDEGRPIRLRFELLGPDGQVVGSETATVSAPPQNQAKPFQLSVQTTAQPIGWRYEQAQ